MSYSAAESYRRMHRTSVLTSLITLVPVSVLVLSLEVDSWWQGATMLLGLAASCLVLAQWGVEGYPRSGIPVMVFTAAVWGVSAWFFDNRVGFLPLVIVGSLVVPRLPRRRFTATAGFSLLVAGLGALRFVDAPFTGDAAVDFVLLPGGITLFTTAVMFLSEKYWAIFRELERARKAEAELGVVRERMRFASELHDIQGHTLHVVKLKVALARRLVGADDARAERELQEVDELVGGTITQTKELAYAEHRLNLAAELQNARNLLEAADVDVTISTDGQEDLANRELLSQLLRETTTNILRHTEATTVTIAVSAAGLTITNDGAGPGPPRLGGLAMLQRRIAEHDGVLTVDQQQGRFLTEARFPAPSRRDQVERPAGGAP